MPDFYERLSPDVIRQGSELYENFSKTIQKDTKTAKITDVFLINTGHGLEFLEKHCLKAYWLRFKKVIKAIFRIDDTTFNIEKHLEVASKIIAGATSAEDSYFDSIASQMSKGGHSIDGKTLRSNILELGLHLKSIQSHVVKVRKGRNVKVLQDIKITLFTPNKTADVANRFFFKNLASFRAGALSLCKEALKDKLTTKEIEEVVTTLSTQADYSKALVGLEKAKMRKALSHPKDPKDLEGLHLVLLKSLATLSEPRARIIKAVIEKIEPQIPSQKADPLALEKFAKIFGDAFIADSGFEGDWSTRPYVDLMQKFIEKKEASKQSPGSEQLQSVLKYHVDLQKPEYRTRNLKDVIKPLLEKCPFTPKRCLLLGGWQGHAIVYEVVKQNDGNYAFRVYNEGQGINQHDKLLGRYKDAYQGCIGVKDIPEHLLFQTTFLNTLSSLITMPNKGLLGIEPDELLRNHLMPMLDGAKEELQPDVIHYLSPQRSGTCTYRSLMAFVANFMPQNDYKQFKIDFKLFMLEEYLPKVRHAATTPIATLEAYELARRQHNVLMRSCEKFANGVNKLRNVLPVDDVVRAELLILRYKAELAGFEKQITAFEKQIYGYRFGSSLTEVEPKLLSVRLPPEKSFSECTKVAANFNYGLYQESINLLEQIRNISADPASSEYVKQVEDAVHVLAKLVKQRGSLTSEWLSVADALFRKIGSIHNLGNLRFTDPHETFKDFLQLIETTHSLIEKDTQIDRARYRGLFLFASFGLERVLQQLPSERRILNPGHLGILCNHDTLLRLRTSDPFWTKIYSEIDQFVKNRSNSSSVFSNIELANEVKNDRVTFNQWLIGDISSWWNSDANKELRKTVEESVKKDREVQKKEIQRRTAEAKEELAGLEEKLKGLLAQKPEQSSHNAWDWEYRINICKGSIEKTRALIAQIPTLVANDSTYWPPDFETVANFGGLSDKERASFFLSQKPSFFASKLGNNDIFPEEFRKTTQVAIACANVFEKKGRTYSYDGLYKISFYFQWSPKNREVLPVSAPEYDRTHTRFEDDSYIAGIKDPKVNSVYKEVFDKPVEEGKVAARFAEFEKLEGFSTLDSDEAKELYSLLTSKDVQIESVLSYFRANLDKLQSNDWLNFFHSALFLSDILYSELADSKKREHLISQLESFFSDAIKNASLLDDAQQVANLIWVANNVQRYVTYTSGGQEPQKIIKTQAVYDCIQQFSQPKFASSWPVVFEALLASFGDALAKLPTSNEEKKLFATALFAHIKHKESPAGQNNLCIPRLEGVKLAQERLLERLSELDRQEISDILNTHLCPLLQTIYPAFRNVVFHRENDFTYKGSDGSKLALVAGELIPGDPSSVRVYSNAVGASLINDLVAKGFYDKEEDLSHLRCHIQSGIAYIKDNKNDMYLACGSDTIFAKKGNEGWRCFIPISDRDYCPNLELQRGYHHFQENHKIYIADKKTFKVVYESKVVDSANSTFIEAGKNERVALRIARTPQNNPFAAFEAGNCTTFLADSSNKIQKIEFSRLGLTLVKEKNRFLLAHDKTWHVADEQYLPHFGKTTGFLLLENDKGEKKALLPVWGPKKLPPGEKKSLNFPYEYDFKEKEAVCGRYVECDVVSSGVVPKTLEARYYLAKIYLEKGRVDEARQLLDTKLAESTSIKLTANEHDLLQDIVEEYSSNNTGSQTIRVKMQALCLLEKNDAQFPEILRRGHQLTKAEQESQAKHLSARVGLIEEYVNRLGHLPPIDYSAELALLQGMVKKIDKNKDPKCYLRLCELQGKMPLDAETIVETTIIPQVAEVPYKYVKEDYQATATEKMLYKQAREKGDFPFSVLGMTEGDMNKWYGELYKEMISRYSMSPPRLAELLSALYYLTFFASDSSVRGSAQKLLNFCSNVAKTPASYKEKKDLSLKNRPKHHTLAAIDPSVDLGLLCLQQIHEPSGISREFMQQQASSYLDKRAAPHPTITGSKLFDPNCPQAKDAASKKQFQQSANDIQVAQNRLPDQVYSLKPAKSLQQLLAATTEQYEKEAKLLAVYEEAIVGSVHSAITSNAASHFDVMSKKRFLPTVQELAVLTAREDYLEIAKTYYPELTQDACKKLKIAVRHVLAQKQLVQQLALVRQTAQDLLKLPSHDQIAIQTLYNNLGRVLEAKHVFGPEDSLATVFLLIETTLNITLRLDQVENIRKVIKNKSIGRATVLQMIMGAGKTSVLQPLLAFLLATPNTISTVMVPDALVEPVRQGLTTVLGAAVSQAVFTLPYDRELARDVEYLASFEERLQEIKTRTGVLLVTPRQKHSIITSLNEAYYELKRENSEINRMRVDKICKITELLQLHEYMQIDEIDMIMNPMVIFKYPLGAKEVVNTERASLISELIVELARDKALAKTVTIDFAKRMQERVDDREMPQATAISPDLYATVVQPRLVEIAFGFLQNKAPIFQKLRAPGYDTNRYLDHFACQSTPYDEQIGQLCTLAEEKELISAFTSTTQSLEQIVKDPTLRALDRLVLQKLIYHRDMLQWIRNEVPDTTMRDMLGVVAVAISTILPSSLLKECGTNYGLDPNNSKYVAKPYEAAGSPKPTQYANPYEQVVYSTQMALYYGLPAQVSEKMLLDFQQSAKLDMHKNSCTLEETEGYGFFKEILGESSKDYSFLETPATAALKEAFHKAVSKDPKWILYYMKGYVYPQISRYAHSLSSTAQTLVASSKLALGYTGTLSEAILARNMEALAELGTDGKTISAVESKKPRVYCIKAGVGKKCIDSVRDMLLEDKDLMVYTDSGGWLKEENIERFSEKLLVSCEKSANRKNIKSVIYHNAKGAIVSLERNSEGNIVSVPLAESSYNPQDGNSITIIQQKYETGTNILQKALAVCEVSIRKGMTLRDALQSISRMRQILQGQSVVFAISEEVKHDMASGIVQGLLQNPMLSAWLSKSSTFDLSKLEGLALEPELETALNAACRAISNNNALLDGYRAGRVKPREFHLAFLKEFNEHFVADSASLWRYFASNTEQEKAWLAGCQRMREVVERPIRMALSNSKLPLDERVKLSRVAELLALSSDVDEPFESMARASLGLDANAAIAKEAARYKKIWNQLYATETHLGDAIIKRVEANALELYGTLDVDKLLAGCIDVKSIPPVVYISESAIGQELEQEAEAETEAETETEQEAEVERELRIPDEKAYVPLVSYVTAAAYKIGEFFTKKLPSIREILPSDVQLMHQDLLFYSQNLIFDKAMLGSKNNGTYGLPGRYVLAIQEEGKPCRYVMCSHNDAARIKQGIYASNVSSGVFALFSLDGKIVAATDQVKAKSLLHDTQHRQILAQAKLLMGRSNFTKAEVEVVKSTLKTPQAQKSMRLLYENIIKYKPASRKRYAGSYLEKMFTA